MYQEKLPGLGLLELAVLRPAEHAPLVHGWVTAPRAVYWGMGAYSVDEVREVYEFVDGLPTHHAFLITLDGTPIGLLQTYEPAADPVGERYEVEPGDIGMHLLMAPGPHAPHGLTNAVAPALVRFMFADPTRQRVVAEPDVRNERMLHRLRLSGFTFAGEIDMPGKRAQLAFLTRARFEADHPAPS